MRLPLQFHPKLFLALFFAFVLSAIVGTLSHELGHYVVAKSQGLNPQLHYDHVTWKGVDTANEDYQHWKEKQAEYSDSISKGMAFPGSEKYYRIDREFQREWIWRKLGGPIQTMLTGFIALMLLFVFQRRFLEAESLQFWQWLLVFLSLFWLRQPFILISAIFTWIYKGHFPNSGDEYFISWYFGLPSLGVNLVTGMAGLIVLGVVVFRFIPSRQRFTFLLSGCMGGVFGAFFWLEWIGSLIIP